MRFIYIYIYMFVITRMSCYVREDTCRLERLTQKHCSAFSVRIFRCFIFTSFSVWSRRIKKKWTTDITYAVSFFVLFGSLVLSGTKRETKSESRNPWYIYVYTYIYIYIEREREREGFISYSGHNFESWLLQDLSWWTRSSVSCYRQRSGGEIELCRLDPPPSRYSFAFNAILTKFLCTRCETWTVQIYKMVE